MLFHWRGRPNKAGISPVARDWVMELVGLEPTTRVLWNVGVSDQLTLSDTKHSSSKRPAIDGHFHKSGNLRCARMRGRAGRTRTNHQSVSPTSSPQWRTTGRRGTQDRIRKKAEE